MSDWTTEELEGFYRQNVGKALMTALESYRMSRGMTSDLGRGAVLYAFLKDLREVWPDEFKRAMELDERPAV
jgi:hypothetical protein